MSTSKNIQLGLLILIGSTILILTVYLVGAKQNLFGSSFTITSTFSNASGLQVGNNVRYSGINVGTVTDMELVNDTSILVTMKLNNQVKSIIRNNAITTIGVDGLVGSALINIYPSSGRAPFIDHGDQLVSSTGKEMTDIINTFGTTNDNIAIISRDLQQIIRDIKEGPGTISSLIQDAQMANDLQTIMLNLRKSSIELSQTTKQMNRVMDHIMNGDGLVQSLLNDTIAIQRLHDILEGLNSELSEDIYVQMDSLMFTLNRSADMIYDVSKELGNASYQLNRGSGTAHKLLYDSVMSYNIQKSLEQINQGTARFNENMEALKKNFLFRRYFRKKARQQKNDSLGFN